MDFNDEDVICRLCLKKITENCERVEEIIQYALNFLTLCPNLAISDDPMMCETCAVNLKRCFDFKGKCLSTEECIASFPEDENKNFDLRYIFSKIKLDGDIDRVPDGPSVCRFCLKLVKDDTSISLGYDADLIALLQKYFLEMDLKMKDVIIACIPCYNSLRFHVSFVSDLLSVEEKINEYSKIEGENYKNQVDLRDVAAFVSKSKLKLENISAMVIKKEQDENIVSTNVGVKVKLEDLIDVEQEEEELVDKEFQLIPNNSFQHPSPSESDHVPQLTKAKPAKYKCDLCNHKTKKKFKLDRHMLTHKTDSDINLHKCNVCDYKTKWKQSLNRHILTHKMPSEVTMYKCETCAYETKRKSHLVNHMLTHKTHLEVTMYKCHLCGATTKRKTDLRRHIMSIHMPKTHEMKRKSNLKSRMLTHKTHWEFTIYKCETCAYETKFKRYLKSHMLTHKTHSEITMYMCDQCGAETKRRGDLKRHMLTHRTHSETTMYKCEECGYESRRRDCLQQHILTHMDRTDIEMHQLLSRRGTVTRDTIFKCHLCDYKTKWKSHLKRHMPTH